MTTTDWFVRLVRSVQPMLAMGAGSMLSWGILLALTDRWFSGSGWCALGTALFYLAHTINLDMRKQLFRERMRATENMSRLCAADARWGKSEVDSAWERSYEKTGFDSWAKEQSP